MFRHQSTTTYHLNEIEMKNYSATRVMFQVRIQVHKNVLAFHTAYGSTYCELFLETSSNLSFAASSQVCYCVVEPVLWVQLWVSVLAYFWHLKENNLVIIPGNNFPHRWSTLTVVMRYFQVSDIPFLTYEWNHFISWNIRTISSLCSCRFKAPHSRTQTQHLKQEIFLSSSCTSFRGQ